MTDDRQSWVPDTFLALFLEPGRSRPSESRAVIQQRYAFCEDLATLLTDTARSRHWELRITETDVLDRIHAGLTGGQIDVTKEEALWVRRRLAELLGWREGADQSERHVPLHSDDSAVVTLDWDRLN
jgi:hypothetical protein